MTLNYQIKSDYTLKMVDITGKELLKQSISINQNKITINLRPFTNGLIGWYLMNKEGVIIHSGKIIKE